MIEQYLRHFCNYYQDNWGELLPSTKFATNNIDSVSINYTFFLANRRQYPRLRFKSIFAPNNTTAKTKHELVDANKFVEEIENMDQELQDQMVFAQAE